MDIEKAFLMVAACCSRRQERLEIPVGWWHRQEAHKDSNFTVYKGDFQGFIKPFLHNATVKHVEHYRQEDPEFVDKFLKCLFVDDLSSGAADQDGAYENVYLI